MRRIVKCRFPQPSTVQVNLAGETLGAAADFVWALDTGHTPNPESLRVLRDALERVLVDEDPKAVFPNQPRKGQRRSYHERDLVVAGYIEWRHRIHTAAGSTSPLEDAKNDAAQAFPWGGESGRDGARNAWRKHRGTVSGYSDQVLEGLVARFRCN